MSKKVAKLVNLWVDFEEQNPDGDLLDFCKNYISYQESKSFVDEYMDSSKTSTNKEVNFPLEGLLGWLISRLNKFAGLYIKKALVDLPIHSAEEFGYLAGIQSLGAPKKSELILLNLSDFTSGIEILKRLMKNKLISEVADATDKRSKRVTLTPIGMETIQKAYLQMDKVGKIVFDNFTSDEKFILLKQLNKLNDHHTLRYVEVKNKAFDELTTNPLQINKTI
jgi:hypothetical protein